MKPREMSGEVQWRGNDSASDRYMDEGMNEDRATRLGGRRERLFSNVRAYDLMGGLYDGILGSCGGGLRARAAEALALRGDERLLIVGVGSGLELAALPRNTRGVGVDLSGRMLERARRRRAQLGMKNLDLRLMDARTLDFPDESFDAIYLPLIVTVVEDGARVLSEAARVAAGGGRIVVADRFWPEERTRPRPARAASWVLGHFAMRFDRRFSEIHAGADFLEIEDYERVAPGSFFHLATLRKPGWIPSMGLRGS